MSCHQLSLSWLWADHCRVTRVKSQCVEEYLLLILVLLLIIKRVVIINTCLQTIDCNCNLFLIVSFNSVFNWFQNKRAFSIRQYFLYVNYVINHTACILPSSRANHQGRGDKSKNKNVIEVTVLSIWPSFLLYDRPWWPRLTTMPPQRNRRSEIQVANAKARSDAEDCVV